MPHAPQSLASPCVLTHGGIIPDGGIIPSRAPAQGVVLPPQHGPPSQLMDRHCPDLHDVAPIPHLCPQAPQLLGSFARSAQPRPHMTAVEAQVHTPELHAPPDPQELSQEPQ